MKKDINFIPVKDVQLAVVQERSESHDLLWRVHIMNKNKVSITNILISSKGYGEKDGEKQSTSILRHFIELLVLKKVLSSSRLTLICFTCSMSIGSAII